MRRRLQVETFPRSDGSYHSVEMELSQIKMLSAVCMFAFLFLAACGTSNESVSEDFAQVRDEGKTLSIDQFIQVGLKRADEYDVSELPGALSAYLGYFQII